MNILFSVLFRLYPITHPSVLFYDVLPENLLRLLHRKGWKKKSLSFS